MDTELLQCLITVGDHGEVLQEPVDQPYGVRDRAFRDPAGNMLRFVRSRAR